MIRPKVRYGQQSWDTFATIDGYEHDSVTVEVWTAPAEPDVNAGGECEVTGVYLEDQGCQMGSMTDEDLEQLQMRVEEHFDDINNPDNQDSY